MKKIIFLFCVHVIYLLAIQPTAQVAINATGALPHPNAMLDINGGRKGLLIPRGDAAFRTFLNTNTAKGLLMYDTVDNNVWVHNGNGLASGWKSLAGGNNFWAQSGALGTEIKNTNSGGFWSAYAGTITSDPGAILPPVSGAGTRLMWMPQKSAFRVGTVTTAAWDAANIGIASFGSGWDVLASGIGSTALGVANKATGENSTAMGSATQATGRNSTAMGSATQASGNVSTAMGSATHATGSSSTAMGSESEATGDYSTAMGSETQATGRVSTAMGSATDASGSSSTAMGEFTTARSYSSIAMGYFNDSIAGSNQTSPVPTDPLLIVGNGTSNTARHNALVLYKNGNMVLKNPTPVGSNPASFSVPISGVGTRLMWLPQKGAFRVGTVDGNHWDAANIGLYSLASGFSSSARGEYSTAMGSYTLAAADYSTAMGNTTLADGDYSTAIGHQTAAYGENSTAMGHQTVASGENSTAMGDQTLANGLYSTAMGYQTKASSNASTAMGAQTRAIGLVSTTMGQYTTATGENSTAMGFYTTARSYASVAMGYFNDSIAGSSQILPVSTDPLLIVGNGTLAARSNALVIYKNGNADISGYTQLGKTSDAAPAIKMKEFSATTKAAQNNWTDVHHDLAMSKILSVSILVDASPAFAVQIPPSYTYYPGYEYHYHISATDIVVINSKTNSFNILNKPIKILVTYKE